MSAISWILAVRSNKGLGFGEAVRNLVLIQKGTVRKSGAAATTRNEFSIKRGSWFLYMATVQGLDISLLDIDVCIELERVEFKVPLKLFGTKGCSAHREGRVIKLFITSYKREHYRDEHPHWPNSYRERHILLPRSKQQNGCTEPDTTGCQRITYIRV